MKEYSFGLIHPHLNPQSGPSRRHVAEYLEAAFMALIMVPLLVGHVVLSDRCVAFHRFDTCTYSRQILAILAEDEKGVKYFH